MVGSRKRGSFKVLWHMHTYPPKKREKGAHARWSRTHHWETFLSLKAGRAPECVHRKWQLNIWTSLTTNAQTWGHWLVNTAQGQGQDRTGDFSEKNKHQCPYLPSWLQIFIPLSPKALKWKREVWGEGSAKPAPSYHRDAGGLMDSERAVCMWLTPWLTASLQHPQTSPVN